MFKSRLWSYHSCLLLSSSLSNMHTQIFTDHITFCLFFLSLWFIKIFHCSSFFQGKNVIWENGNEYWKVLVPLKRTGAALAVLLAWTWAPAKKPSDVICRWECHNWVSCQPALFTGRISLFFWNSLLSRNSESSINNVLFYTLICVK